MPLLRSSQLLCYCPMGGVDSAIDIRIDTGVRICDRDAAQLRPAGNMRPVLRTEFRRIVEIVVFIRITMRPAVDRDRSNITCAIKATAREGTIELRLSAIVSFCSAGKHADQQSHQRSGDKTG